MGTLAADAAGIGALADPVRRELYQYVCAQDAPVSREQAAEATGIAQHRAKFHLDRLEADGLLDTGYARTSGRTGPGAGRTAKLYHRAAREIAVSLPARDYELAGRMMADAIAESTRTGEPVAATLDRAAAAQGRAMVGEARAGGDQERSNAAGGRVPADVASADTRGSLDIAEEVLAQHGYEPRREQNRVVMSNCPFHGLAGEHPELVCGMNLSLLTAMAGSLKGTNLLATLEPAEGRCCVVLTDDPGSR